MIFVSILVLVSLQVTKGLRITTTPLELVGTMGLEAIDCIIRSFSLDFRNVDVMSRLLAHKEYDFQQHYNFQESASRLPGFLALINEQSLHATIFNAGKLAYNPRMVRAMNWKEGYLGNLFKDEIFCALDWELKWPILGYALRRQLYLVESTKWLTELLLDSHTTTFDARHLFKMIPEKDLDKDHLLSFLNTFPCEMVVEWYLPGGLERADLTLRLIILELSLPNSKWCQGQRDATNKLYDDLQMNLKMMSNAKRFSHLFGLSSRLKGRAYWGTLMDLAMLEYDFSFIECAQLVINNFSEKSAYVYKAKEFFDRVEKLSQKLANTFSALVPSSARPNRLKTLPERRLGWLKELPVVVLPEADRAMNVATFHKWNKYFFLGRQGLPLNAWLTDMEGRSLNMLIVDEAKLILQSQETMVNSRFEWHILFLAWIFLILGDCKIPFRGFLDGAGWGDWARRHGEKIGSVKLDFIVGLLISLGVLEWFSLGDVRQLIDSAA